MVEELKGLKNAVENTLSMYAYDYVTLPAWALYDESKLPTYDELVKKCHIYIIGEAPHIDLKSMWVDNGFIYCTAKVLKSGVEGTAKFPLPEGMTLVKPDGQFGYHLTDESGEKYEIPFDCLGSAISADIDSLDFHVLYVGQAYGKDGSRNAIDRLREHSTLQKIAVKGVSEGCTLQLILIGLNEGNCLHTTINPFAEDQSDESAHLKFSQGREMLFDTAEIERVAIYEAALIRYFQPMYNKIFRDSFPSTNLKVLKRCYEKDMQAVVAEFCIDWFPYRLCSEKVKATDHHFAHFYLHDEIDRKSFFWGE